MTLQLLWERAGLPQGDLPGGLRELYGNVADSRQYSVLLNILLAY